MASLVDNKLKASLLEVWSWWRHKMHYCDGIMGTMASQITSLTIVYSTVHSGRSKKTSKLRVTGLCAWNSPVTGDFPAKMASKSENVSIWWRHHGKYFPRYWPFVIPHTKASDAGLWCFLWSAPEQTVEHTMVTTVIWDAITLIMTSL